MGEEFRLGARGSGSGGFGLGGVGMERLAGALYGETLFVEQMLDAEQELYILAAVETVAGAGFFGGQGGEVGFPVAEDIGLYAEQSADFADAEVELIGDLGGFRL